MGGGLEFIKLRISGPADDFAVKPTRNSGPIERRDLQQTTTACSEIRENIVPIIIFPNLTIVREHECDATRLGPDQKPYERDHADVCGIKIIDRDDNGISSVHYGLEKLTQEIAQIVSIKSGNCVSTLGDIPLPAMIP